MKYFKWLTTKYTLITQIIPGNLRSLLPGGEECNK